MVCADLSFQELYENCNSDRNLELERVVDEIIERRDFTFPMLFSPNYFRKFPTEHLSDQILLVNGLALEASKLDDSYRKFSGNNSSDPNYEQLQYMLSGVKRNILREIKYRQNQEA